MYAVVGCGDCDALWVVTDEESEDAAETAQCPRCGKQHRRERLRPLASAETADEAREARTALLAERGGADDASLPGFGDDAVSSGDGASVVADDEYLAASGLDPDEVAAAGERAGPAGRADTPDRRTAVRNALADLDAPTEDDVAARAAERGVDPERARETLEKLVRAGEAVESGGRFRSV